MAWRLAGSLVQLRGEVRAVAPGTTVWDIGDPAHAVTWSDQHHPSTNQRHITIHMGH